MYEPSMFLCKSWSVLVALTLPLQGARNLYTKESIMQTFLSTPITSEDPEKRNILIFHCEFSSERGPNL